MVLISLVIEFLIATAAAHLAQTPVSWVALSQGHFVMACGDDDGAEIPCNIDPPDTESCE